MSYQVLARQWRPHHFNDMIGQEHVLRMLINALDHQRLHHAYLFSGTRGVGKTTIARIFAKCVNCETGITATPCGTCSTCQAIDNGHFLDLIEVDAASRTKVEDTRELLENVHYPPTQGRYKMYLIDEVHMLSGHSFNALLKTLEEPPVHVKFLLATTDPKRLPITILSRCLQFKLKQVPVEKITEHLAHICKTEAHEAEPAALQLLAEAAEGSVRDALSLLDQAIAYCPTHISTSEIRHMLGSIEQDVIFRLLNALAAQNGNLLWDEINQLAEYAPDFHQVLNELISVLHQVSVTQIASNATHESIKQLATTLSAQEVQLYYQIGLIGQRDLPLAPTPRLGFEMVMLRMLAFSPITDTLDRPSSTNISTPSTSKPTHKTIIPETATSQSASHITTHQTSVKPAAQTKEPMLDDKNWANVLPQLNLTGMAYALASNCTLNHIEEHHITLALSINHQPMLSKKLSDRIEESLSHYFQKPMKLTITIITTDIQPPAKQQQIASAARRAEAVETIQNDAQLKELINLFNAKLDVNSIHPVDNPKFGS